MRASEVQRLNKGLKPQHLKYCNACGETKAFSEFGVRRDRKDALRSKCRSCESRLATDWHFRNADRSAENNARWYSDKERTSLKNAAYRAGGRDASKPWKNEYVGYHAAHTRVKAIFGPARNYQCQKCIRPAANWSYDGCDPAEFSEVRHDARTGIDREMRWSGNPDHYMALCLGCHNKLDRWGSA